uniref:Acyl-coenzyme A thioesterase 9-like n=1 Tax=Rhizophora mucronata TaxID=61149 RepID=A0A2P2Q3W7_RHIMU
MNPLRKSIIRSLVNISLKSKSEFSCNPNQLSKHRLNDEFSDTLLPNSSKQPKISFCSSISVPSSQNFVQERSFACSSSVFSLSNASLLNEPIVSTHLSKLSRRPRPKLGASSDSIQSRHVQRRELSSDNSNPPDGMPNFSTVSSPLQSSAPIDAGSSIRKPISLWPGMYHSPVTNALWEARSRIFEKSAESHIDGALEGELVAKPPSKSRTSVLYKFSSDFMLREQYRNPWNEIRMGKLVEDLDALAGTISYKHCCNDDGTTRPLLLVTASVDRIVLAKPIRVDADVSIVGAVTWVGRSSMEIQLEVTQWTEGSPL